MLSFSRWSPLVTVGRNLLLSLGLLLTLRGQASAQSSTAPAPTPEVLRLPGDEGATRAQLTVVSPDTPLLITLFQQKREVGACATPCYLDLPVGAYALKGDSGEKRGVRASGKVTLWQNTTVELQPGDPSARRAGAAMLGVGIPVTGISLIFLVAMGIGGQFDRHPTLALIPAGGIALGGGLIIWGGVNLGRGRPHLVEVPRTIGTSEASVPGLRLGLLL
jgi:hypothetical protein